ncbi:chemotaxis protein CheA [Geopsychrobacter electrodiphilus]|uniref:chemotaxis protein CheA n=1 Tax=Geopsychrobacter electrodiphilus TaxID=225196 RepID=UPI00036FFB90|nr:chemotaxis protein CheA [Geopsychrobacter electrodiphilus]
MGKQQAVDEFLAEAEELLEKLSQDLAILGDGIELGDVNPDLLNGIFRDAHSMKGLAGMFGFTDIAEIAHHLETLLDKLRLGKVSLNGILLDLLFDTIEGVGSLVRGKSDDPNFTIDVNPYIQRIENLLSGQGKGHAFTLEALNLDQSLLNVLTEYEEHRLQENLSQGKLMLLANISFPLDSFDSELSEIISEFKHLGEVVSTLPGASNNDPSRLAFRILFATKNTLKELTNRAALKECQFDIIAEARAVSTAGPVLDTGKSTERTVPMFPVSEDPSVRSVSHSVRVDIGKLDTLMNLVGELGLVKGSIAQVVGELSAAGLAQSRDLAKAAHAFDRRLAELQKAVMDVRMVPVRQLFDKMGRIVRRMAQELGKKVELKTFGADTEFDKLIAEDLADPLMHIIRNSLDHGIEPTSERLAAGKPEVGCIELRATQRGNHVVLEISDDGKGIDPEVLRRKGISNGLIDPDGHFTRQDLFGLLFHPGFSTREEVSEYSGRGVGMDVVKNNISSLSGIIDIDSVYGKGTLISLTLPITLAIIKALVVRIQRRDYAIPLTSVLETLLLEPGMIKTIDGQEVIELRQQTLPLLRLNRLFGLDQETSKQGAFIVVTGFADRRIGIVVEELRGQQDVVIKSLGKSLSFVKGIAGAADLGNQKTVLVLDVSSLITDSLRGDGSTHV